MSHRKKECKVFMSVCMCVCMSECKLWVDDISLSTRLVAQKDLYFGNGFT